MFVLVSVKLIVMEFIQENNVHWATGEGAGARVNGLE